MSNRLLDRFNNMVRRARGAVAYYTGSGSGLWDGTGLTEGQRERSVILQDTRRSLDQWTWRKQLAYARQLFTNFGEFRGPIIERAVFANSGGWLPRHVGKNTDKRTRAKYEEALWDWMKVCNIRGQPYDFWTDSILQSVSIDRDGGYSFVHAKNRNGDPRIQSIAQHRIYSRTNVYTVTEQGPYYGMKFNNGIVFDDAAAPVAYYVLDESLQFTQATTGHFIPARSMSLMYNPDWEDGGRGVTAMAHGIKRCFDLEDIHLYLLLGVKRNAALPVIEQSEEGPPNAGEDYLTDGTSEAGDGIVLNKMAGGGIWHVRAKSGAELTVPTTAFPDQNTPEYMEYVLMGLYQGLPWPYEFTRMSKDAKGANIRVTVEKVNHAIRNQWRILNKINRRKCTFAIGTMVDRGELPPGEWWAWEFPMPPELTADKYREYQEDRENYKLGIVTIQDIAAKYGCHWRDDIRTQRDDDMRDKLTRVRQLAKEYPELSFREVLELYEQRSPNPSVQVQAQDDEAGGQETQPKPKGKPQ